MHHPVRQRGLAASLSSSCGDAHSTRALAPQPAAHRATLALDAYRARLDARVNRLMWDIVSTALFVGVLLATAYVMYESRALEQNLVWRTLLHADLQSPINMVLFIND